MSAKEKNPFRPGNGIVPPFVAGREQVLESFSSLLDENSRGLPRNLILYGLRGTGKTVMLQLFRTVCEEKGWLFAEREFNERFRDEEFFAEAFLKDVTNLAS
ncbi:MAG: ATP-binding protein [Candidatus Bathyarchaeia archaeon]